LHGTGEAYRKVAAQNRKPAISLERGKTERELLLTAYIKSDELLIAGGNTDDLE